MMNTQSPEKGFDRGAWLTLAGLLLLAIIVLTTTFYILSLPGDGWQMVYEEPPLTAFLGHWPTDLQAGDVVLAVDGEVVGSVLQTQPYPMPANWRAGAAIPYTVIRDGEEQVVDVLLGTLTLQGILAAIANTMLAELPQMSWFIIGLLVFFLRPRSLPARLLLVAGTSIFLVTRIGWAATTISSNFAPLPIWYLDYMADTFWGWLFFPSLILLLLVFPEPLLPSRALRRATPILFLAPLALAIFGLLIGQIWPLTIMLVGEAGLIFIIATWAVVRAYRHGLNRVARAQIAWVSLGIALSIGGTLLAYLLNYFAVIDLQAGGVFLLVLSWLVSLAMPVCLAIAILRYRLFDINVIIRKTLQYTVLTGVLALIYLGTVIVLQAIVGRTTGEQSPLVIVLSTLLIAALFTPLRRRIQDVIDRRFFRSKYNAQQVLAQFAKTARDETDVEALTAELVNVVQDTMQPQKMNLWLKR